MATPRTAFSDTTRAELRTLLAGKAAAAIPDVIDALELGVANWRILRRVGREGDDQFRRERKWLMRLERQLEAARHALTVALIPSSLLYMHPARMDRLLALGIKAIHADAAIRKGRAGRDSRFILNLNLARALQHHGVPLTKSRSGLAHRIFVVVYAELGLSREGDVFRALKQGVDLTRTGWHVRRISPAARQVLQSRRK